MRSIAYLLIGLMTLVLQGTLVPALVPGSWLPNLILVWIILLAALRSRRVALWTAIIGGILHDTVISNFFGLHLFPYVIVAYALSSWAPRMYQEQWYLSSLTVALWTLLDGLLRMGLLWTMDAHFACIPYFMNFTLPEIIANAIIAIGVHWILWRFAPKVEYRW